MNEQKIGRFIKQSLDQGVDTDSAVLAKLRIARETALDRQRTSSTSPFMVWATNWSGTATGPRALLPRLLIPTFLLVGGLFAVNYWYQVQRVEEIVEIDAAVLLGDLPLDAYLDKGFGAWLKSSSED